MENRNRGEAIINASKVKLAGFLLAASLMVGPAPVEAQDSQPSEPAPGTMQLDPEWTENGVRAHWQNGYYSDMSLVNPGVVPGVSTFGLTEGYTDPASNVTSVDPARGTLQLDPAWTKDGVEIGWTGNITTSMSLVKPGVVPNVSSLGTAHTIVEGDSNK